MKKTIKCQVCKKKLTIEKIKVLFISIDVCEIDKQNSHYQWLYTVEAKNPFFICLDCSDKIVKNESKFLEIMK